MRSGYSSFSCQLTRKLPSSFTSREKREDSRVTLEQAGISQAQGKPDTSFLSVRLWTEFSIQRDRVGWGSPLQPSVAGWVLALGVPQLFWELQLQLGAQKGHEFGFKLFLGLLQLPEAEGGGCAQLLPPPSLASPFLGQGRAFPCMAPFQGISAPLAGHSLCPTLCGSL